MPAHTWTTASAAWLDRQRARARDSLPDMRTKVAWLSEHGFADMPLAQLDADAVSKILALKRRDGVTPATLNRYYAVIRAVMRYALARRWCDHVPPYVDAVPDRTGRKRVVRWLTPDEWAKILAHLPPHLAKMASFALATGLRQHNVTHLRWEWVHLERKVLVIPGHAMKAEEAHVVPLSADALAILTKQGAAADRHRLYVFPYRGEAIDNPAGRAWRNAVTAAGLERHVRWHDLRHTWATWHAQNGTPPDVLMKLGGWHSIDMVLVYAQHTPQHLAQFADNGRPA